MESNFVLMTVFRYIFQSPHRMEYLEEFIEFNPLFKLSFGPIKVLIWCYFS